MDTFHSICPKLSLLPLYKTASSSSTSSLCWFMAPPLSQSPTLGLKVIMGRSSLSLCNYSKTNSCYFGFTDSSQIYPVLFTLAQAFVISHLAIAAAFLPLGLPAWILFPYCCQNCLSKVKIFTISLSSHRVIAGPPCTSL